MKHNKVLQSDKVHAALGFPNSRRLKTFPGLPRTAISGLSRDYKSLTIIGLTVQFFLTAIVSPIDFYNRA